MSESATYDDATQQAIASVAASTRRQAVLGTLVAEGPLTPAAIHRATGDDRSNISTYLNTLRDVGAVELLVPEETSVGRLYAATERGETVAEVVGCA